MKRSISILSILTVTSLWLPAAHDAGRKTSALAKPQMIEAYCHPPLSFEANQGQTDQRVKFLSQGSGYSLFLTGDEAVLALKKPGASVARDRQLKPAVPTAEPPAVLRMRLVGANAAAKVTGLAELPGKSNYFIGNDPKKWRTNVPNYAKVKYDERLSGRGPGVLRQSGATGIRFRGSAGRRSQPDRAPLRDRPWGPLKLAHKERLCGSTEMATWWWLPTTARCVFTSPWIYQPSKSQEPGTKNEEPSTTDKKVIDGNYVLNGNRVTFEVASYDKTRPLVIDPTLAYSTYLGGSGADVGFGIAVDASGNAYVTGNTVIRPFPHHPGRLPDHFQRESGCLCQQAERHRLGPPLLHLPGGKWGRRWRRHSN